MRREGSGSMGVWECGKSMLHKSRTLCILPPSHTLILPPTLPLAYD